MLECWSYWPSAVEEVLKFRLFFVTNKKLKKTRGEERRRPDGAAGGTRTWPQAGLEPARRWDPHLAIGLSRAAGYSGFLKEVFFFNFFLFLSLFF